ncbi:AAA family ATPase [Streptomyces rubiginosohelvolus]|uniref:AAA family ATPase n=1 Tax=Streptomyces rubiginosohelvolus TaxID=67362 RepID=UPI00381DD1F0
MNRLTFETGTMCTLIGPPGCGKTTFAAQWPDTWRVFLDVYRKLAADTETDQSATPLAVQTQNLFLDARLARGLTTIVDSTSLSSSVRAGRLTRAARWERPAVAVLFNVPLATGRSAERGPRPGRAHPHRARVPQSAAHRWPAARRGLAHGAPVLHPVREHPDGQAIITDTRARTGR